MLRLCAQDHPVNKERVAAGKPPANIVLLRGCGSRCAQSTSPVTSCILSLYVQRSVLLCQAGKDKHDRESVLRIGAQSGNFRPLR